MEQEMQEEREEALAIARYSFFACFTGYKSINTDAKGAAREAAAEEVHVLEERLLQLRIRHATELTGIGDVC